ncbi:MAG: ABC transporter ATP-binding protein [Anaerolineaceae bacterium]|nr:ABC transporter ATP-binding protein [Anaerolineaceae bacterium]
MAYLLEVEDLAVEVDGQEILHGVNLGIPYGEVHALLGPNGSGKTSLMMTIMGFSGYKVTRGRIRFDGEDITDWNLTERARLGIGVAQQRPPTIQGVKLNQILEYSQTNGIRKQDKLKDLIHLAKMDDFLTRDINAGLSGGEIRRSELLQLLATRPRFVMMDEIDSGVDIEAIKIIGEMANMLYSSDPAHRARRNAGLLITHGGQILDHVVVDKAHILLNGSLACSGNPRLVLNSACSSGYEECVKCFGIDQGVVFNE